MTSDRRLIAITACAAALVGAGGAVAATQGTEAAMAVGPQQTIASPAPSPIDFPGVRGDKAGAPLAKGAVVVGRAVKITRGSQAAYPVVRLTCPRGKTLRTMGFVGQTAPQPGNADYVGKRSTDVLVDFPSRTTKVGDTVQGTVYGYCR